MKEFDRKPKENAFFSIVLSIYNVEKYLDRCIKSILDQSFGEFQLILVDDGSTDSSPQICERWKKQDERIEVIHKENAGLGYARNTGLDAARGKYILFIDSDDYVLPCMLEKIWESLNKEKTEAIFYGFQRIDNNGKCVFKLKPSPVKNYYSNPDEIKNVLLPEFIARNPRTGISRNLRVSAWNCCINLDFLKNSNIKFVSEREYISEDIYFYIELFAKLHKVSIIQEVFYCYCQNVGSLTFSYKKNRFERIKDFYQKATDKADELGYDGEVQLRLKGSFISSLMACLKMEVANFKKSGFIKSLFRVKEIVEDTFVQDVLKEYSLNKYKLTWRFFAYCISNHHIVILYFTLLFTFYCKGI